MAGHAKLTASAVVLTSGKPVRIFGYSQLSGASGAGVVTLYSGTDTTGTKLYEGNGIAGDAIYHDFGEHGKFFPSGCFASLDADVSYVDFDCEQVQSA